jgi:poly-beta-1,6-N-acetyl-D-glucosamine synthase
VPATYFEELLREFAADPTLGIASGACFELGSDGWHEVVVTGDHLRGATRAYRRACLRDVLPLDECVGWDGIDIYRAHARGWTTRTIRRIRFKHHRLLGQRDGTRMRAWCEQGRAAHFMGYRSHYILFRTLRRLVEEPAALAMLIGYVGCVLNRTPRIADRDVLAAVRRDQSLGRVPERVRQSVARGLSDSTIT